MMSKELDLLDEIEEIRQKAAENPERYPVDYAIRLASALVHHMQDIRAVQTGQMN